MQVQRDPRVGRNICTCGDFAMGAGSAGEPDDCVRCAGFRCAGTRAAWCCADFRLDRRNSGGLPIQVPGTRGRSRHPHPLPGRRSV